MGEQEQLNMDSEPVVQGAVVIPSEEKIVSFHIDRTKSDLKWSSFTIITDQRSLEVGPGSFGDGPFDTFCDEVLAMFQTTEGQAVLAKMKVALQQKPLQVNTVVTE